MRLKKAFASKYGALMDHLKISNVITPNYVSRLMGAVKAKVDTSLNADTIAACVEGESIANIKEVLQSAINVAIGRCELGMEEPVISLKDIEEACSMVLRIEG